MQATWLLRRRGERARVVAGALAILAATLLVYAPAFRAGFVWDDDTFLTANPLIRAPDGLWRIWFTGQGADYWPLTSSTLWIEWRLWGMNAWGYHATNVILQVMCALLAWAVLRRMRVPGAFLGALLFAVHPLGVESVAWITQRKTLLAGLFSLASGYCFLRSPIWTDEERARGWHGLSVVCFALAMLAKTSAAFLPVALLGYLAWRGKAYSRALRGLAPFAVIAASLAGVAWVLQRRSMAGVVPPADALQRLLRAAGEIWFYLGKTILPVRLSFIYPQWKVDPSDWLWWVPLAAFIGVSVGGAARCAQRAERRRTRTEFKRMGAMRSAFFAWGYFCCALLPTLGFADFYFMRYSPVADHYAYLALIGVTALAGAGWEAWRRRAGTASAVPWAGAAAVVAVLGALSWQRCRAFADAETLYRDTLAKNPAAWMAHNNLAMILEDKGRGGEALQQFEEAVRLKPDWADAHFNLGVALEKAGQSTRAIAQYEEALHLQFVFPKARLALADLLTAARRVPEAFVQDQLAFATHETAQAHCQLGDACAQEGRIAEALAEYRRALAIDPKCQAALDAIRRYQIN